MDWLGRAKLEFTSAEISAGLRKQDGSATDFLKVCKESVPPCQLNPFLFNGHLQTCWTVAVSSAPAVHYKRKIFEADHPEYHGSFAVDFVSEPFADTDDSLPPRTVYLSSEEFSGMSSEDKRPMLVILHGLSGGSHEVYLRHAIAPMIDSKRWEACVVNSRGCANSKITSGILYNARATWDTRQVVKWLRKQYPTRPLFGLGFSLGANILTNYIGEEGSACQLKAAFVCANPWNLEATSYALNRTLIGHHLYQRELGSSMKKLIDNHEKEIQTYTELSLERISNITFLYEFDREVQCPTWGYPSVNAYYRDASCVDTLLAIRIPVLGLNATDDPVASSEALPYEEIKQNPYVVLCTTTLGGHLGWFELGGGRWHSRPISNFFNRMAFDMDLESFNDGVEGDPPETTKTVGASFDPICRKMQIPINN